MSNKTNQPKGFTIIEVVLVLAIAALIFLLVFLALPALQRSRRDTQRRDDVSRLLGQVTTWQANNNGQVPATDDDLDSLSVDYLKSADGEFNDPQTGSAYTLTLSSVGDGTPADLGIMNYFKGAKCVNASTTESGTGNQVAVIVKLEGSPSYCVDNS
ncbi:MAG TPA: prepilin-type N-terminal cleavage/methylation domain-containing protein [Candidatus Saccharimonadales bacterium]|nr:prepilin-type N-terminal cleavage/methylation domain-containing protein [Candidatus Saccharimonadales bacterium]